MSFLMHFLISLFHSPPRFRIHFQPPLLVEWVALEAKQGEVRGVRGVVVVAGRAAVARLLTKVIPRA